MSVISPFAYTDNLARLVWWLTSVTNCSGRRRRQKVMTIAVASTAKQSLGQLSVNERKAKIVRALSTSFRPYFSLFLN